MLKWREADEMHTQITKGHVVESLVVTPEKLEALGLPAGSLQTGWWVGFKVDPVTFAKVQSGEFQMFSIEGTAQRVEVEKYSPDQPRDPGGPGGGRWIGAGGSEQGEDDLLDEMAEINRRIEGHRRARNAAASAGEDSAEARGVLQEEIKGLLRRANEIEQQLGRRVTAADLKGRGRKGK